MKTAIVFGVTGQDGSYLTDLLLSKDYRVVGVARRSSVDTTERLSQNIKNADFIVVEGDITDAFCVSDIINKFEPAPIIRHSKLFEFDHFIKLMNSSVFFGFEKYSAKPPTFIVV